MDANPLSLVLECKSKQYTLKAPVIIYATLVNHSDGEMVVNGRGLVLDRGNNPEYGRLGWDLTIELADAEGRLVRRKLNPSAAKGPLMLTESDFVRLKAKSDYTRKLDLSIHFQLDKAGVYTATAKYQNARSGAEYGHAAWLGELFSNQIQFEIAPAG